MKTRTIFFNGPKGHRWVTVPVPLVEAGNHKGCPYDDCAQNRRCFFGALNAIRSRLVQYGLSTTDIRKYYAKRFSVERMAQCTPQQWTVAAAEVQAMRESQEIFLDRVSWFKTEWKGESYD